MTTQNSLDRAILIADRKFVLEIAEQARFSRKQADRATRAFVAMDPATGVDAAQKAAAAGSALVRLLDLADAAGISKRHSSAVHSAAAADEDGVWDYFDRKAAELG